MDIAPSVPHRMLLAPLDWGLGHATRMIPLVHALEQAGADVFLAADGHIKTLLEKEFPHLQIFNLQGYGVRYSKHPALLPFYLLKQLPSLIRKVKQEQHWLIQMQQKYHFDAVISDNRYGLHHPHLKSIFITHQLRIKAPAVIEGLLQKIHYRFIEKFDECWVPDMAGEINLSGTLAHPRRLPSVPVKYIGPLSRFSGIKEQSEKHLLILLSGPEPQRTLLEKQMLKEMKTYTKPAVLVRGLPGNEDELHIKDTLRMYNHLPAEKLETAMRNASFVISRSGYSTVMDLAKLQKKSILVPTPGQTEQSYLGRYLMKKKFALCVPQQKFRLLPALDLATHFPYTFPALENHLLKNAVKDLLQKLSSGGPSPLNS